MKICISAETTIDLPKSMLTELDIHTIPFTLILGDEVGKDGEITPDSLYAYVEKSGKLPHTSAINQAEYEEYFASLLKDYDHVIHFALSSCISSSCEHAVLASKKFMGKVDVIDTHSLSTGIAVQAMYAKRLADKGIEPAEIVKRCEERKEDCQASFSLESVNYLYKGGRCSALAMLGANLLKIKPEIYVKHGSMGPGKKYRGPMMKVVQNYVEDTLAEFNNPDLEVGFVTYSTAPQAVVDWCVKRMKEVGFRHVYTTVAGATISCHCGPHCLGILYYNDGEHPAE